MTEVNDFAGSWTCRSFIDKPEIDAPADDVLFAAGALTLEAEGGSEMSGQISFGSMHLTVSGTAKSGNPPTILFRATGVEGSSTAGWIYDFVGYRAQLWPKGVEQRPAIVGTVIRTVPHNAVGGGEVRPAGYTLSFIAVSRDPAYS